MKTVKLALLTLSIAGAILPACKKDVTPEQAQVNNTNTISTDVLSKIKTLGFSTAGVIKTAEGYIVENDILLTPQDLNGVTQEGTSMVVAKEEQYRTTQLVTGLPRTITVGLSGNFPTNFSTALDQVVKSYQDLGLRLKFARASSGTPTITITAMNEGPNPDGTITLGISAGFPTSSGNPASGFKLNVNSQALGSSSAARIAATMRHEIGHAIGFRHTDYFSRSSCPIANRGNEGTAGIGAVQIPGTPSGVDATSWMTACLSTSTYTFNANDIKALNYLYK